MSDQLVGPFSQTSEKRECEHLSVSSTAISPSSLVGADEDHSWILEQFYINIFGEIVPTVQYNYKQCQSYNGLRVENCEENFLIYYEEYIEFH